MDIDLKGLRAKLVDFADKTYEENPLPDTSHATTEEATALLARHMVIPDFAESFLGRENIAELHKLMQSPALREIDFMYSVGDISVGEAVEYGIVLQDVLDVFSRIILLSKKMAAEAEREIFDYIDGVVVGQEIHPEQILKILGIASEIYDSASQSVVGISIFAVAKFCIALHSQLSVAIYKALASRYPKGKRAIIKQLRCDNPPSDIENILGKKALILLELQSYENFFRINGDCFDGLLKQPIAEEELTDEASETMFVEIQTLSQFRSVSHAAESQGISLDFFTITEPNTPIFNAERPSIICRVRVSNPKTGKFFTFEIDRVIGGGLKHYNFNLSEFIGDAAERHLRHITYSILLEYLRKMPEDIAPAPMQKLREITGEVKDAVTKIAPEPTPESPDDEAAPLAPTPSQRMPRVREATISHLKGVSGNRIKKALETLLGKSLRTTGSHEVFRCRDGKTYPIAFHGSGQVGTGLLRECLRRFGITAQELYDTL